MKNLNVKTFGSVADAFAWILDNGYALTDEKLNELVNCGYIQIGNYHIVIDENHDVTEKYDSHLDDRRNAFFDFFCRRGCLLVTLACAVFWTGIYFAFKLLF